MKTVEQKTTKFWIDDAIGGVEMLRAVYKKYSFPRHFHDTYVIIVQETGVEEFYCRGASHLSPVGSVAIGNPGEIHTGSPAGEESWGCRAIYPTESVLQEIAGQCKDIGSTAPYFPSAVIFDQSLVKQLLHLHYVLETSPDVLERQTAFTMSMAQLITRFSENKADIKPAGKELSAIKIAREYIEANYQSNVSLDQLSTITGLNQFYLVRAFRKKIGPPPHEFLMQVRVKRTKELLSQGMPIVDAALETGFVDQSHLTNRFK